MPTDIAPSREEWEKYEKLPMAKQQEILKRYEHEFVRVPITDSDSIRKGDHLVAEGGFYDHHMLVTEKNGDQFTIAEYTGPSWNISASIHSSATKDILAKAKIMTNSYSLQYLVKHKIRKIIWPDKLRRFSVKEVIERAYFRIGKNERYYDALRNNCEHFVTWCICGLKVSLQVKSWPIALYFLIEGSLYSCREKIKDAGIQSLLLMIAANASDELAGLICENSELIGFGLAIAIEAGMAVYNIYRAVNHCETSSEFFVEFFNIVAKAACRLGAGFVGSSAGAAVGGPLLSFIGGAVGAAACGPLLSFIGGAIGASIGNLVGFMIGRAYEDFVHWIKQNIKLWHFSDWSCIAEFWNSGK